MAGAAADTAKPDSGSGAEKPAESKPAGEPKPGEQKPAATDPTPGEKPAEKPASKDGAPSEKPKAPEKYTLTLPDGGRLDQTDLDAIAKVAKAEGWSNEEAQARVLAHAAAIEAQSAHFLETTKADPVYGGAHLDESLKHASRALDTLRPKGDPRGDSFRTLLDKSGYGNHLEVVAFLADLGKLMAEDGTAGGSGGASPKHPAEILYDKS